MLNINTRAIKKLLIENYGKHRVRSVRLGTGTSHHWVHVEMFFPELDWRETRTNNELRERIEKLIEKSGIELAYYPDEMTEDKHSCLSVEVRTI